MFAREQQVAVTYFTWKRTRLAMMIALMLLMIGSLSDHDNASNYGLGAFALGLPMLLGIPLLLSVVKWQFCNPRAQLLPGFARAHLTVMFCWLGAALVVGPTLFSLASGFSLLGCLAYALLAGGLVFSGGLRNRGGEIFPAIVVIFSGYGDFGVRLWWAPEGSYVSLNVLAACFGAGLIVYRTIQLVRLDEEDDAYQVVPMEGSYSASRMVQAEQRKLVGRWIEKNRLTSSLLEYRFRRLATKSSVPRHAALDLGWAIAPPLLSGALFSLGMIVYALAFRWVGLFGFSKSGLPPGLLLTAALVMPTVVVALRLQQRRPQMVHELLLPATRDEYFGALFALCRRHTVVLWFATHIALLMLAIIWQSYQVPDFPALATGFALVSLSLQLPALAAFTLLACSQSRFVIFIIGFAVIGAMWLVLSLWWKSLEQLGYVGATAVVVVASLIAGALLMQWARRAWLAEELA